MQVMAAGPAPGKAEGRAACSGGAAAVRSPADVRALPGAPDGLGAMGELGPVRGTEGALKGGGVPV